MWFVTGEHIHHTFVSPLFNHVVEFVGWSDHKVKFNEHCLFFFFFFFLSINYFRVTSDSFFYYDWHVYIYISPANRSVFHQ